MAEDDSAEEEGKIDDPSSERSQEFLTCYESAKFDPSKHMKVFSCRCPCNMALGNNDPWACSKRNKTLSMFLSYEFARGKVMRHLQGSLHNFSKEEADVEIESNDGCIYVTHVRSSEWRAWQEQAQRQKEQRKKNQKEQKRRWQEQKAEEAPGSQGSRPESFAPLRQQRHQIRIDPYGTTQGKSAPLASLPAAFDNLGESAQRAATDAAEGSAAVAIKSSRNLRGLNQTAKHVLLEMLARVEASLRSAARFARFMADCYTHEANTVNEARFDSNKSGFSIAHVLTYVSHARTPCRHSQKLFV